MNSFDRLISELSLRCDDRRTCSIYYEVAPTGRPHLGILRCLVYIRNIASAMRENGIDSHITLRMNDRSAVTPSRARGLLSYFRGYQYKDLTRPDGKSLFECADEEFTKVARYVLGPEIAISYVSEIYSREEFIDIVWGNLEKFSSWQAGRQLFYPKATSSSKLYDTRTWRSGTGFEYETTDHLEWGSVNSDVNGGLYAFRVENVACWKLFSVDLDIHADNHTSVFKECAVFFAELFETEPPLASHIGLSIALDGRMCAKSEGNGLPVLDLIEKYGERAISVLALAKPWRPIEEANYLTWLGLDARAVRRSGGV